MNASKFFVTMVVAAAGLPLSSCVVPPPGAPGAGYYRALPAGYVGDAYWYGGRYYYGGRWEAGRFRHHGRFYDGRYVHGGHVFYGGRLEHHGAHPAGHPRVGPRR